MVENAALQVVNATSLLQRIDSFVFGFH